MGFQPADRRIAAALLCRDTGCCCGHVDSDRQSARLEAILAEDFNTAVALGSYQSSTYARRFFAYTGGDTFGHGVYDARRVNSVAGGLMDWYLHKENGQPYVSALVPVVPATGWGQRYGRYSVRFRSDVVPWVQDGVPVVAG